MLLLLLLCCCCCWCCYCCLSCATAVVAAAGAAITASPVPLLLLLLLLFPLQLVPLSPLPPWLFEDLTGVSRSDRTTNHCFKDPEHEGLPMSRISLMHISEVDGWDKSMLCRLQSCSLVAWRPSSMLVYLRNGYLQTFVCAVTLPLQIKFAVSSSHVMLTPSQPVPALTL